MAKRDLADSFARQFVTGIARKAGWRTWDSVERQLGRKVVDPNSRLRKAIQRFHLSGNVDQNTSKTYGLIELFIEEYAVERGLLQKSMYFEDDAAFIQRKITYIGKLCQTETEIRAHERLMGFWNRAIVN